MDKNARLVLIIAILASFVAFLDSSVINVALPAIGRDLSVGLSAQQWIVDAYLLTLGSFILIAGSLSDLFGRKKVLQFGLVGFLIASIFCGLAPNTQMLILGRALQGLAGALLVPSSLAMIISTFKGKAQGKAVGSWTAWTGISFIIGPLLGGFLVDAVNWRLVFWINVIPIAVTLALLRVVKYKESLPKSPKVDIVGALLCAITLGSSVFGFIEQPNYGWTNPLIFGSLLLSFISLVAFIWYEKHSPAPMLPLDIFMNRNFSVGNISTLAIYAGLSISTFTLVIFLQSVGGFSALQAGMSLLPITIIMFILSPRFGSLSGKYGPRFFMTVGPILASVGFISFLLVKQPFDFWTQILPGVLIFGVGLSMTVAPLTSAVLGDVPSTKAGIASAINNAVSRVAGLLAIALIGLVVGAAPFTGNIDVGIKALHKAAIAMAILLLIGGLTSYAGIRNKPTTKKVT